LISQFDIKTWDTQTPSELSSGDEWRPKTESLEQRIKIKRSEGGSIEMPSTRWTFELISTGWPTSTATNKNWMSF